MAWMFLLGSAVLEAVWATALDQSDGFTKPVPTAVFLVTLVASMVGLERASRSIPIATAYAVWAGSGAALTVAWAMATGAQDFSPWSVVCIAGVVAAVIGLKLSGDHKDGATSRSADVSDATTDIASSQ